MLTFHFTGVDGQMREAETLISGMAGKQARLEFSPDWGGLSKTAVFMAGEVVRDAVAASDEIVIPAEICVTVNKSYITYEPYTITYEGGVSSYIVLQSPDGSQFWLSVEDDGTVTAVPVNSGGMDSEPHTAIEWKISDRTAVTAAYASTTAARSIRFDSYLLGIADNGYWNGGAFAPSVTLFGEDFTLTAKKADPTVWVCLINWRGIRTTGSPWMRMGYLYPAKPL